MQTAMIDDYKTLLIYFSTKTKEWWKHLENNTSSMEEIKTSFLQDNITVVRDTLQAGTD